ncbi:MAG TPA: M48 family metalloprotease [Gemmatimonadales bacterium]|nr:M48 family metalloprotease [Gemmatimonadales bacterium]
MNLFEQQRENRRRSVLLVAVFVLFFAWVGFGGDWAFWLLTRDAGPGGYRHAVPWIGVLVCSVAAATAYHAWKRGADRVLWATGAWEVVEPATEAQRRLVNVVEEMAIAAGLPRPRIWVVPDDDPNAFATGMSADRAHVAVTAGLLERLSRDELQAVVAHELSHVRNLDVRLMTLLAALLGAIALMSDGFGRFVRGAGRGRIGGSGGGGARGGGKGKGNPLGALILALWVLTLVIAPVVSRLLAMAVSRGREYLADATAAQLTRHPAALAAALEKLAQAHDPTRAITRGAAHLCIVDPLVHPFSEREGFLGDLLASHPPMQVRVARLRAMAFEQQDAGAGSGERGAVPEPTP